MSNSRERRSEGREPAETSIQIEWVDSDVATRLLRGRCKNVSTSGIGAAMAEPVPLRKAIRVRLLEIGMTGNGVVRHCLKTASMYLVGIALTEPLRSND